MKLVLFIKKKKKTTHDLNLKKSWDSGLSHPKKKKKDVLLSYKYIHYS
jgi:hypothetical protein